MPPSYQARQSRVNGAAGAIPAHADVFGVPIDPSVLYPGAAINLTPAVHAIGAIHFEGNIIPHTWYTHPSLQHGDGKANLVAVTLLAEICYWYRPTIVHDEMTGRIVSVSKKFAADRLHWNHEQRAGKFGMTRRQVADAIVFLRSNNLIDVEIRDRWTLPSGAVLYNQVFIEPIPQAIRDLCGYEAPVPPDLPSDPNAPDHPLRLNGPPPPFKRTTPSDETEGAFRSNGGGGPFKRSPSTENTKEISTKTSGNVERSTSRSSNIHKTPLAPSVPEPVQAIVSLTGDAGSVQRFVQLWEITFDNDLIGEWDRALEATRKVLAGPRSASVERPGAYFSTVLVRRLEKRQIFVPTTADGDRDSIRGAVAASLNFGE